MDETTHRVLTSLLPAGLLPQQRSFLLDMLAQAQNWMKLCGIGDGWRVWFCLRHYDMYVVLALTDHIGNAAYSQPIDLYYFDRMQNHDSSYAAHRLLEAARNILVGGYSSGRAVAGIPTDLSRANPFDQLATRWIEVPQNDE